MHTKDNNVNNIERNVICDLKNAIELGIPNKMQLHYGKTTCMLAGTRQKLNMSRKLNIQVDDISIQNVSKQKLLGILIDENLSWSSHIDYLCSHITTKISLLRHLSEYVPAEILKKYYQGCILSFFDYGSVTWGSASASNNERLTKLQKRATRIILRTDFHTSSERMFKELGWSSVPNRIKYNKAVLTNRALIISPPEYIRQLLQPMSQVHSQKFFDALKTVYGPQSSGTTPLLNADGTSLLTDKEAILKRWAEHFDGVLNRPSSINDEAINRLPQVECNPLLDELPTVSEAVKAIKLLSSGKAPGLYAIPAEIYKAGGPPVAEKLTELFHIVWRKEAIPQDFKNATIIHLFKRKGKPQICDNHRGISLLSMAWKILARVLLNRLNEHLERSGLLPESQCEFRKNRGTIEMIFTARQLQEKCQEQNVDST